MSISDFIGMPDIYIYSMAGLLFLLFILFILCIVAIVKAANIKKRFNRFMLPEDSDKNIEEMLIEHLDRMEEIDERQSRILNSIDDINERVAFCVQKVGIVRYNPFEGVGGDLSFAIALLDEKNDGVVINSIYSRDGCYVYAKNIENGVCNKHQLAEEEKEAIREAIGK